MSALADRAVADVRKIHLEMIDAVLAGGGVEPVAAIAAEHLGGPVKIVLGDLTAGERGRRRSAEVPVRSGEEVLGHVALYDAEADHDVLELAAIAALTAVTLRDANITQRRATADFLDDLRAQLPATEIVARARRLGADLSHGASALSARGHNERILATIAQDFPGALAAPRGDRVEALLPGDDPAARRLARRLGTTGLSPFEPDPAALGRALHVAELSAELDADLDDLLRGSQRLLLASDAAARQALVDSTIGPAGELSETVRAYLAHGANMNATAATIYAHRHTVASRLDRVRALTGHDPLTPLGQAQLALGLQALDIQRAATRLSAR
ncbi:PucR family transcriptional regulator [Solirubrobacter soli]|uniref:PucR family transcriptional regulator n=1 Tax=Solirubrobacter soli TaxID=363832 RepID=UPI000406D8D7|nr:helix-turn-helix domain-containing protein [Solirubrobacter soli]